MTDMITIQFSRELPNGEEFVYQYQNTDILSEKLDDAGAIFKYHWAHFMADYAYVKDNLEKEIL